VTNIEETTARQLADIGIDPVDLDLTRLAGMKSTVEDRILQARERADVIASSPFCSHSPMSIDDFL
jgi:hypothetical protein